MNTAVLGDYVARHFAFHKDVAVLGLAVAEYVTADIDIAIYGVHLAHVACDGDVRIIALNLFSVTYELNLEDWCLFVFSDRDTVHKDSSVSDFHVSIYVLIHFSINGYLAVVMEIEDVIHNLLLLS